MFLRYNAITKIIKEIKAMKNLQEKEYVESIRRQYQPESEQESGIRRLSALDRKIRRPAEAFAYLFGTAGALVLGLGMCLAMKVIGNAMPAGIVIGLIGIGMISVNFFLYQAILKKRKNRYAKQVLALSDKLLNA